MNAPRWQLYAAAALVVLLVGVLIFQFTRSSPSPPAPPRSGAATTPAPANAATKTAAAAKGAPAAKTAGKAAADKTQIKKADVNIEELLAGIKEVDFDYDKERLARDPLMPLVGTMVKTKGEGEEGGAEQGSVPQATPVTVMNKVVSGILWDANRPMAVVDNEVVYPGYTYADGTVVESIERDLVVFRVGDSLIQVQLKEL